jgi:hypothetical protein
VRILKTHKIHPHATNSFFSFLFFSLTPHFRVANQLSYFSSAMASSYWSVTHAASSVAAMTSLVLHPRNCKPQNPIFEVVVGLTNASTIKTTFVLKFLYPTDISLKERIHQLLEFVEGKVRPVN